MIQLFLTNKKREDTIWFLPFYFVIFVITFEPFVVKIIYTALNNTYNYFQICSFSHPGLFVVIPFAPRAIILLASSGSSTVHANNSRF